MKNKQKEWRLQAVPAKAQFIAQGLHEPGRRYGRLIRNAKAGAKFAAMPSVLFQRLAINGGYITGELPNA